MEVSNQTVVGEVCESGECEGVRSKALLKVVTPEGRALLQVFEHCGA